MTFSAENVYSMSYNIENSVAWWLKWGGFYMEGTNLKVNAILVYFDQSIGLMLSTRQNNEEI